MKRKGIIAALLFIVFFFSSLVWADTNGVWHLAEDVRPGVMGSDEGDTTTPYTYQNPVHIEKTLEVQKIKAKSGENLVIQLG